VGATPFTPTRSEGQSPVAPINESHPVVLSSVPESVISLISLIRLMSSTERFTTVPVKSSTLHALQAYRVGGKSYDDIIWDFIEANPPASFWKEVERRSKEPDLTLAKVRRSLGL
jgi:hypothetical protein